LFFDTECSTENANTSVKLKVYCGHTENNFPKTMKAVAEVIKC